MRFTHSSPESVCVCVYFCCRYVVFSLTAAAGQKWVSWQDVGTRVAQRERKRDSTSLILYLVKQVPRN